MSNTNQTFWSQLQGDTANKVLFWLLNLGLVLSLILAFTTEDRDQYLATAGVCLVVQAFNVGGTYFNKERKALRK
ncbi:hypothetical protein Q5H92_14665 [Hymenobacter sp. M29]|uniref:SdpI/YhfL protein family protein n=1 Tax=Hymenobacter mellowenesis TaxID=3063995 RepID=A0ABT9ADI4_9BACT|nr:hypothetical protein [Hymenobacter sp. M29]MDO7847608.1 hypothetical protein [Hymenobacter sp. M29]